MKSSPRDDISVWETEGGASSAGAARAPSLSGSPNQVEWAQRLKVEVDAEFDRVAGLFRSIAATQRDAKRADTEAIIAIVEEKRAEVMGRPDAGYFIRNWQEITDQVRQMVSKDPRYQAIKGRRPG